MAGARVDHHEGASGGVDLHASRRRDAHQAVIHRPLEAPSVCYQLDFVIENVRDGLRHMLTILLATPAHDIEKQYAALPGVHQVFKGGCKKTRQRLARICRLFHHDFSFPEPARDTMLALAGGLLI